MSRTDLGSRELVIRVTDMSCDQCERNVEGAVLALDGVVAARADAKRGEVTLTLAHRVADWRIRRAIADAGYTVESRGSASLAGFALSFLLALACAFLLLRSGLAATTLPAFDDTTRLSAWGFAVLGLLSSLHCVSMCGGLVALGVMGNRGGAAGVASYNAGRLVSYAALGALLGAFGSAVSISYGARFVVGILCAVAMLLVGASLTGLAPWAGRLMPLLPASLRGSLNRAGRRRPFVVGLLNGLMPCGPLQAMQLAAVASGSALLGALDLGAFCLGTMPLMVVFGLAAGRVSASRRRLVSVAGGIAVMSLSIVMLTTNLARSGVRLPLLSDGVGWQSASSGEDVQRVRSELEPGAYPNISVRAGIPVRWELEASHSSLNGCNSTLIMPEWGVEQSLVPGTNVIEFTPERAGEFGYSCWMGMIRATVTVT